MPKVNWQKAIDTLAGGASESGGAIWGIMGQDVLTDREAELAAKQMELDAQVAQAQAEKDKAIIDALGAKSAGPVPGAAPGAQSGRVQRPRPAGMPLARSSSSTSMEPKTLVLVAGGALLLYLLVKK